MNEETPNHTLELLRSMREEMRLRFDSLDAKVEGGFSELRARLSAVEHQIAGLRRDSAIDNQMRTMLMNKVDALEDTVKKPH
jgi:hypothetical protein